MRINLFNRENRGFVNSKGRLNRGLIIKTVISLIGLYIIFAF